MNSRKNKKQPSMQITVNQAVAKTGVVSGNKIEANFAKNKNYKDLSSNTATRVYSKLSGLIEKEENERILRLAQGSNFRRKISF